MPLFPPFMKYSSMVNLERNPLQNMQCKERLILAYEIFRSQVHL